MSDPPDPRPPQRGGRRLFRQHSPVLATPRVAIPLVVFALGCAGDPSLPPEASAPDSGPIVSTPDSVPIVPTDGFRWGSATAGSQGMCGSTTQLGCTTTLEQIWNSISDPKHNTKRFVVIRNDKVIFDRGGTLPYFAY